MEKQIRQIEKVMQKKYSTLKFSDRFKQYSIKRFLQELPIELVTYAMREFCEKMKTPEEVAKYFCGICWNMIKSDNQNVERIKQGGSNERRAKPSTGQQRG